MSITCIPVFSQGFLLICHIMSIPVSYVYLYVGIWIYIYIYVNMYTHIINDCYIIIYIYIHQRHSFLHLSPPKISSRYPPSAPSRFKAAWINCIAPWKHSSVSAPRMCSWWTATWDAGSETFGVVSKKKKNIFEMLFFWLGRFLVWFWAFIFFPNA